jgi:hypothetical protein
MKINISLLALLLALPIVLLGQSDKKEKIQCTYPDFPTNPLNKLDSCYTIKARVKFVSFDNINNSISLGGYTKCNDNYDFTIEFEEKPLNVAKSSLQTRVTEYEDKGIKKKRYSYYYAMSYTHSLSCKLIKKDGSVVYHRIEGTDQLVNGTLKEYSSEELANDAYSDDVADFARSETEEFLKAIKTQLLTNFSYDMKKLYLTFYSVKPKKYNYDNFNQATSDALNAIRGIDSLNNLVQNVRTKDWTKFDASYLPFVNKLQHAIKLWEDELKESDIENKKSRINKELTLDLYENLVCANLLLFDFEKATLYAQKYKELSSGLFPGNLLRMVEYEKGKFLKVYPDFKGVEGI